MYDNDIAVYKSQIIVYRARNVVVIIFATKIGITDCIEVVHSITEMKV